MQCIFSLSLIQHGGLGLPFVIAGTACDDTEHRQVSYDEGAAIGREFNAPFFECSAKTGYNVDNLFDALTTQAVATYPDRAINDYICRGNLDKLIKEKQNLEAQHYKDRVSTYSVHC